MGSWEVLFWEMHFQNIPVAVAYEQVSCLQVRNPSSGQVSEIRANWELLR